MKVSISPDGKKWLDVECQTEDIITVKYRGLVEGLHEFESFNKVYKFKFDNNAMFIVGQQYQIRLPL